MFYYILTCKNNSSFIQFSLPSVMTFFVLLRIILLSQQYDRLFLTQIWVFFFLISLKKLRICYNKRLSNFQTSLYINTLHLLSYFDTANPHALSALQSNRIFYYLCS